MRTLISTLSLATATALTTGCAVNGTYPSSGNQPRPFHNEIVVDGQRYPVDIQSISGTRSTFSVWLDNNKSYVLDVDCKIPTETQGFYTKFVQFGTGDGNFLYQGTPKGGFWNSICMGAVPSTVNASQALGELVQTQSAKERAQERQATTTSLPRSATQQTIFINNNRTPITLSSNNGITTGSADYGSIGFSATTVCNGDQFRATSMTVTAQFNGRKTTYITTLDDKGKATGFRDGQELSENATLPIAPTAGVCGKGGSAFKQWFETSVNAALRRLYTPQP